MLTDGRAQFLCDGKAALVIRVVEYPGGAKVAEALAGAGQMQALTETIANEVARWGARTGLTHMVAPGRLGWARALKGWTPMQVVMRKGIA